MNPDLKAIREANAWIAQDGSKPKRHMVLMKRLDRISRRRGLAERTRMVIQIAAEKIEAGWYGHAIRILQEEEDKLS